MNPSAFSRRNPSVNDGEQSVSQSGTPRSYIARRYTPPSRTGSSCANTGRTESIGIHSLLRILDKACRIARVGSGRTVATEVPEPEYSDMSDRNPRYRPHLTKGRHRSILKMG